MLSLERLSRSEDDTEALGRRLAQELPGGTVIALRGDLGAGKTCLVRGVGAGLGLDPRDITSPTFLYLVEHEGTPRDLVHADLYRLGEEKTDLRAASARSIGLVEALATDALICVEWWDYYDGPPAARCVVVEISRISSENRKVQLEFQGPGLEGAYSALSG
jgi:tRNA threonylcarbamoyladenosine biosynthesis protein TsaE